MFRILLIIFTMGFVSTNFSNITYLLETECENIYLETIAEKYFEITQCLTIVRLCEDCPYLFNILRNVPKFVKMVNTTELKPNFEMTFRPRRDIFDPEGTIHKFCPENGQGFIIIVSRFQELLDFMYSEIVLPFWSPQALILIYFTRDTCGSEMKEIFEKLWSIYKTPHTVITGCKCENVLFYKWNEMFDYSTEEIVKYPLLIKNNMSNFNGYWVKPFIFQSPFCARPSETEFVGIGINLLNLMATHLNFIPKIIVPLTSDRDKYGFKLPNGTYTGALRRLLDGDVDFIHAEYFIKDYLTTDLEFSASTMSDELCVIMRKAERIPEWQLLYHCFDNSSWISLIVIYFVMAISWTIIQKWLTYFEEEATLYPYVFTDTFRVLITSSIVRVPTITSERVFLSTCLIACMTLVGAFQGSLFGIYSTPLFFKDINTLEELSKTNTKIKSEYMFFLDDVFSDVSYPVIAKLRSMISFYNDSVAITKKVAEEKDVATLVRKSEVEVMNSTTRYYDSRGYNLIHMVKECPRSYSLAYLFPVNSPYSPKINMLMLRISQAGLLVKWYKEMAFNVSDSTVRVAEESIRLSLKDMQISFYQLTIGLGLSTLIFLFEILQYKYIRRQ